MNLWFRTHLSTLLIMATLVITLGGCESLSGRIPMEVDDTGSIYSGSFTYGIGNNRNKSLKENHHLDLELSFLSTSGRSKQALADGQHVRDWPDSIYGPGVFPQKWKFQKTDLVARYTQSINTDPTRNSVFFFTATGGLSRMHQKITLWDDATANKVSYSDIEISPTLGIGIGIQLNEMLSVNLDTRYSFAVFEEYESTQARIYLQFTLKPGFKMELGYQGIESKREWRSEMDLKGPWLSIGMDIR